MGWLSVTDEQRNAVAAINESSSGVRVNVVRSARGGWLACDDALAEAVSGGTLECFAEWYANLTPSDDVPAAPPPKPIRPKR